MTTAAAASRLRIDQSTVIKMINHGLTLGPSRGNVRLRLKATRKGHAWDISAAAVKDFARLRKFWGV